jgi:hypothetical protein
VYVVEVYDDNSTYSTYQTFLNELFEALQNVNEGSCLDDHDTDPHNLHLMCPTCRYHPCLHGTVPVDSALEQEFNFQNQTLKEDPISTSGQHLIYAAQTENDTDKLADDRAATVTSARLVYYSTLYSAAKWCRSIYQELCTNKDILKKEVIRPKVEPKKLQE